MSGLAPPTPTRPILAGCSASRCQHSPVEITRIVVGGSVDISSSCAAAPGLGRHQTAPGRASAPNVAIIAVSGGCSRPKARNREGPSPDFPGYEWGGVPRGMLVGVVGAG